MKHLAAPLAVLALLPLLSGCPRSNDSSGPPDAAAAPAPVDASGRSIQCLAETPAGDLLVGVTVTPGEVAPDYGVYRLRKDSAASPLTTGLPKASVRAMVVTPANAMVVATAEGVYRSENDGAQWTAVTTAPQPTAYGLIRLRSGRLLAATSHGLLASSDDGKTFTPIGENRGEVNAVVEHPTLGVFAGTDKGVIHSADGNNPWESAGLAKETVLGLVVDARGNLLAGTTSSDAATGQGSASEAMMDSMIGWKGGVLRYDPSAPAPAASSAEPAGSEAPKKSPPPVKSASKAADSAAPEAVPADATDKALDAHWKPTGLQNTTIWAMVALPDGSVLASAHSKGMQRFDAATSKWTPVQGLAPANPVAALLVTSSGAVYAGAVHGLFRSTDQGRTFQRANHE